MQKKGLLRNLLYRYNLAAPATPELEAEAAKYQIGVNVEEQLLLKKNLRIKKRLTSKPVVIKRHFDSHGNIHSTITSEVIANKIYKQFFIKLQPEQIKLEVNMTTPTVYTAMVSISPEMMFGVKVELVKR